MAPFQKDIKDDIKSSNLTVSESDTSNSSPKIKEDSSNYTSAQPSSGGGTSNKKSLKELAQENPTQLGDPVSLKAETSDHEPTDQDRGVEGHDGDLAGAPKRNSKL